MDGDAVVASRYRLFCALALLVPLVVLLLGLGGKAPHVRSLSLGLLAALALVIVISSPAPGQLRRAGLWSLLILVPPVLIGLIQVLPLGVWHPWLAEDVSTLGAVAGNPHLSLDVGATSFRSIWALGLLLLLPVAIVASRAGHQRVFLRTLVGIAACHALLALLLAALLPEWPRGLGYAGRVRGSFVYPNQAAAFWGACLPLAIHAACRDRKMGWCLVPPVVLAVAIVLSASRGGILVAACINLPYLCLRLPRRRRWWSLGGLTAFLTAVLILLNLDVVSHRFSQLRHQADTLNGRVLIWRGTAGLIAAAPPLGCGAGTARQAIPRAGIGDFEPAQIHHPHSDPLEYLLEMGWAGCGLSLLCWAVALGILLRQRRHREEDDDAPAERSLILPAALGLGHLVLHGSADLILQSEALSFLAVLLLGCMAVPVRSRSTGRDPILLRVAIGLVALIVAVLLPWFWRYDRQTDLATTGERWLSARMQQGLPLHANALTRQIFDEPTVVHTELAILQSRLALSMVADTASLRADWLRLAGQGLTTAAAIAPGDHQVWLQRAIMAYRRGDHAAMRLAMARCHAWAPASHLVQQTFLQLIRLTHDTRRDRILVDQIMRQLFRYDGPRPEWFAEEAALVLGRDEVLHLLADSADRPLILRSALGWLAQHASLDQWTAAWRSLHDAASPALLPFRLLALGDPLVGPGVWALPPIPLKDTQRAELARSLVELGLPVPAELRRQLTADGPPWSLAAEVPNMLDGSWREHFLAVTGTHLRQPWVKTWRERIRRTMAALDGFYDRIHHDDDPALVDALQDNTADAAARGYYATLLACHRQPIWQTVGRLRWAWFLLDDATPLRFIRTQRWTGVLVDGAWVGWYRGSMDPAALCADRPGLHRIVLLDPHASATGPGTP